MSRIESDEQVLTRVLWDCSPHDGAAIERLIRARVDRAAEAACCSMRETLSRIAGRPAADGAPPPDTAEAMRALAAGCLASHPPPAEKHIQP